MDEWVERDRITGKGVKVDAHAHHDKEGEDDDRDELTIAPSGHGGSGSLSATIHVHKDRDKKKNQKKVDSEFTEAEHEEHEGMDEASLREHEEVTKVKNINRVNLGRFEMDAWYFSPFPKE
jgi:histone acetyltransferase MYST1